ncbi:MAG: PKD domain-containing protein, partial [Bacteroidota bacterium]
AACVGETIEVSYTGLADASATYTWDFGSATVLSGSGQGPYQISYTAAGTQSVSLTVTEDGCEGPETVQTIEISAPLAAPVISCINPGL